MTISIEQILMVVGGASTITTAIFWGSFLLGRLHTRMERVELVVMDLGHRMDKAGDKMSDLANKVQVLPEKFLTREEAVRWNGSRADDRPD